MNERKTLIQREQLVLSSILFDRECKEWAAHNGLKLDLFSDKFVAKVVSAFNGASIDGTVPTETLLLDQLSPKEARRRSQWKLMLNKLNVEIPPEPKEALLKHLSVLQEAREVRAYKKMFEKGLKLADNYNVYDLSEEKARIKNFIESAMYELEETNPDGERMAGLIEIIHMAVQNMKDTLSSVKNENVTTGYADLDAALDGGYKKGTFAMICARPGMGKTVWMLNSAAEAAKSGAKTLFVSIEMPLIQCAQRLLAKLADLSSKKIQRPETMNPIDWAKLEGAVETIFGLYGERFWIHEVSGITVPQLERMIKNYKKRYDIDSVYVDYAQIMLTKDGSQPRDESDFAQISGGLRRVAKTENIALIVGSQLNRDVEKRPNKRPIMADIRNSGAFEQDAARIIALYRDDVYNEESEEPNILELIFLKNRFGENGVTLKYHSDLERQNIASIVS